MQKKRFKKSFVPLCNSTLTLETLETNLRHLRAQINAGDGILELSRNDLDAQILSESVTMLGGGAAVLMQLAHPFVAWAIDAHSYTLDDTKRRFYNTFSNVFAISFGTLETAETATRRVFATHRRVRGRVRESIGVYRAGDRYSAFDEAAAAWVLATLIDYSIVMYELFVRELSAAEKEAHYQFHRRAMPVWGIAPTTMPATFDEFMSYCNQVWHDESRTLVTKEALEMAHFLLRPLPWEAALGLELLPQMTAYLLPRRLALEYQLIAPGDTLSTSSAHFYAMCAAMALGRWIYTLTPLSIRRFTGAAERTARRTNTPMPMTSKLAAKFGSWIVSSVLSAEADEQKRKKRQ